jgi:N5-(cytidine 5'-diphosphoramidyl)-L-glutamine hydrolase
VKTVGITQRDLPPNEYGEVRYALDVRWYAFLAVCGAVVVPLPGDAEQALRTVAHLGLDALVLSGGDDLAAYGGGAPARDRAEQALLRWAIDEDVPVIGVCRGMQLIAHSFGTPLIPVSGHAAVRHEITTSAGERRDVNSYHRFGVRDVVPPLEADAVCGNVVEQMHHRSARVVGIMWHPEREERFCSQDVALMETLLGGR